MLGFVQPGGVKVDEHRLIPPQDDVFRLHIPVDRPDGVEHPQGPAHLNDDLPGLLGREQGPLQQKPQSVALYVLLQHQIVRLVYRHLVYGGQVGTGVVQQLLIDLRIAGKLAQDELFSGGFVADQADAAPGALFQRVHQFKLCVQRVGKPSVNHGVLQNLVYYAAGILY